MKTLLTYLGFGLLVPAGLALADTPRQECLGRLTFTVPEDMQWAVYRADHTLLITEGGGHGFTRKIFSSGDVASYDYDGLTIRVSDIVDRDTFDGAALSLKEKITRNQERLMKKKSTFERILDRFKKDGYEAKHISDIENEIKGIEQKIPVIHVHDYDLGIPDAYFLGGHIAPDEALLWRNNRVYSFSFSQAGPDSVERIKALLARFQPRNLYEVPKGPGFCFPYGFIADDGRTAYSIKNSLRFTRTPNVLFTLIAASANDPWQTKPTRGTYDSDYRPGYDASKWRKTSFIERLHPGKRLAGLEGWRLDPKPGSGEEERAWFALAHVGGLLSPLLAVQMSTFQRGTDDLTELTPPPDDVIPRFRALSESLEEALAN